MTGNLRGYSTNDIKDGGNQTAYTMWDVYEIVKMVKYIEKG